MFERATGTAAADDRNRFRRAQVTRRLRLILVIALLFTLLAATLRFHKLGAWPFAGDELATITEAASLSGKLEVSKESQTYRLPRAVPLSYLVHHTGYRLLGDDEFASRVPLAAIGSLTVGLVFWLLARSSGLTVAFATSLLLLVWPQHVFHSQENRFYAIAALGASLTLLLGAAYVRGRKPAVLWVTYGTAVLTMLTHTVTIVLLPLVTAALLAAGCARHRRARREIVVVAAGAHLVAIALLLFHVLPLLGGWNPGVAWAYSAPHASLASVSRLGWPVALAACAGGVLAIRSRSMTARYWLVASLGFAAGTLFLPLFVPYHPEYLFPLMLAPIVLAGRAIAATVEVVKASDRLAAAFVLAFVPLLQLPGVASHFADGSRVDLRAAGAYVDAHWTPDARVTGQFIETVRHYAPRCETAIPLSDVDPVGHLAALTSQSPAPLWVVIQTGRRGFDEPLLAWLGEHCQRRIEVRRTRLDYYDYRTDVYRCGDP